MNAPDLQTLRLYCVTNSHVSAWAQEDFQKSLSVNTVHHAIHKCRSKLCHAKKKPYVNMIKECCHLLWTKANFKWTEATWSRGEPYGLLLLFKGLHH